MSKLPVRFSSASLRNPPSKSPATPAKNTPEAKKAERVMSSFWLCMKYCGIQLKNSQNTQP